jgi:hypothetical protein
MAGLWRSLVAHLTGGQGVAGSNPVSPTGEKASTQVDAFSFFAENQTAPAHVT